MWTLENSQLPTVALTDPHFAPLCCLEVGGNHAPLCQIDFQANYGLTGIQQIASPSSINAVTNVLNTIDVSGLVQVDAIGVSGITYLPAKNPANPQSGEFTTAGSVATLTPVGTIPRGLPVQILGGDNETTPTDYIDPSILSLFYGLPIVAEVRWSLSIEGHPSGSIAMQAIGDEDCDLIDRKFKKGTELTIAGIGFSITSYTKTLSNIQEEPGRIWNISISLGGKWEAPKYQRPAFLVPSANPPIADGAPYTDPGCQIFNSIEEQKLTRPTRISVSQLAERVGCKFVGFSSASTQAQTFDRAGVKPFPQVQSRIGIIPISPVPPLDVWSVSMPTDLSRGSTGSWQSTLDGLKRHNGCFVDYTKDDAIYARDLDSGNRWAYSVMGIQIGFKGDADRSPGPEGYAAEYPATRLTGKFSEPGGGGGESTQGRNNAEGNWKRRDPVVKWVGSGNLHAADPPANFKTIRNMAMNWDASGPTEEIIKVMTVDGVEMLKVRTLYGAAFGSNQVTAVVGDKRGPVRALATSFWTIVQTERTETLFDSGTRYVTGSKTTGDRKSRFKQETDALELLPLLRGGSVRSLYEASLYQFHSIPIFSLEQKQLEQFASHYGDVQRNPVPSEMVKRCAPDGTSFMLSIKDPNFKEPMYEAASLSYKNSFEHTRNPESTNNNPLPDLTQGEELLSQSVVRILSSQATQTRSSDPKFKFKTDDDQYIQFETATSSQGANFGEVAAKTTFTTQKGRPGEAQKLPDIYEKEEPEQDSGDPNIFKPEADFDYVLCTPGHDPNQPTTSTIGFENAAHLHQAIVGAETDLKMRDIQESMDYAYTIPTNLQIRPLDFVQAFDGVKTHLTRVSTVENSIVIGGSVDGYPLTVTPDNTQITAGIDRTLTFSITRRPIASAGSVFNARVFGLTIGEIIPPAMQGRGNY